MKEKEMEGWERGRELQGRAKARDESREGERETSVCGLK